MRRAVVLSALFTAVTAVPAMVSGPASADAVADFYRGKEVRIVSSGGAGGGHGTYALFVSRHFGRHIPGKPTSVPQYMPGAGGAKAYNYVYNAAPKDGTVVGFFLQGIALNQAIKRPGIKYDARKYNWIGSVTPITAVLSVWKSAPAKTLEELKKVQTVTGATGRSSDSFITPTLMNMFLGTKIKIVTGYKGMAPIHQAMERGEVHGTVGAWSTLDRKAHWKRGENFQVIAQNVLERSPELPDVPTLVELAPNDTARKVFDLVGSASTQGRTLAAPPGVPTERVKALRAAFDAMMKDPEVIAEAKKRGMPLNPRNAAGTEALVNRTLSAPPEIVAAAKKALGVE